MKERPILFSGPTVRAILEGRKTQTRRMMKTPPLSVESFNTPNVTIFEEDGKLLTHWYRFSREIDGYIDHLRPGVGKRPTKRQPQRSSEWLHSYHHGNVRWSIDEVIGLCPYGKRGDRLWVRETFGYDCMAGADECAHEDCIHYMSDIVDLRAIESWAGHWKPSIFMPRWACRITLEITDVRVQRLQEISKEDAVAEGIREGTLCPIVSFSELWDSINAKLGFSWDVNPWVWAITFKGIEVSA